jgi:carbon-monoxide dehydrogenase medium subunit
LYEQAGDIAAAACDPVTDRRGSAAYKRHLARELTLRVLRTAVGRIGAPGRETGGDTNRQGV